MSSKLRIRSGVAADAAADSRSTSSACIPAARHRDRDLVVADPHRVISGCRRRQSAGVQTPSHGDDFMDGRLYGYGDSIAHRLRPAIGSFGTSNNMVAQLNTTLEGS